MRKRIGFVLRIVLILLLGVILTGGIVLYVKLKPLYIESKNESYAILSRMNDKTFKMESATRIYDKDENLIGRIGVENYEYATIDQISPYVQDGYIATEDKNFKIHNGIDLKATLRAAIVLLKNKGAITQGGSTITMQVLKNTVLTQERTFGRKAVEMVLAIDVEKQYNKAQIMEYYLNTCYYGNQRYGIQSASKYYFGKDAADLTLAEAAMLVGTSNRPNALNPIADYNACLSKKDMVLKNMLEDNYVTEEQYREALYERPDVVEFQERVDNEDALTTYAIHSATLKVMELDEFPFQYTFATQEEYDAYQEKYNTAYQEAGTKIREGGYQIYTSLDPTIQKAFQDSVDVSLQDETEMSDDGRHAMQAAGMCVDNETGMIVAVVGGRSDGGEYNRAFQAKRPGGSVLKPLVAYGPAINEGITSPGAFWTDEKIDINGYHPINYNDVYHGKMTLREALARSSNSVAVQALNEVGVGKALEYMGKMKFRTLSFADNNNLSIALGSVANGVTVEDVTRAYAAIENQGMMRETTCIKSIVTDLDGELYKREDKAEEIFNQDTAFMLTDMLQGVCKEEYGTANGYLSDEQQYAGKTGTTNNNEDIWFAGFSPYYTAVTWVGYDIPRESETLADDKYTLRMWSVFMDTIHQGKEKIDYPVPDTILLDDGSEAKVHPQYTSNVYASRPAKSDYISGILQEKVKQMEWQQKISDQKMSAEEMLKEFEAFQIESTDDVQGLEEKYNKVLEAIEGIEVQQEQTALKERLAKKYELLSGEVTDKWNAVLEAEKAEQEKNQYIKNQENSQKSIEQAETKIHDTNLRVVQSYIDFLNERTVYTDALKEAITAAREALKKCEGYSEYNYLNSTLNQAINNVQELPTEAEVKQLQETAQAAADEAEEITDELSEAFDEIEAARNN